MIISMHADLHRIDLVAIDAVKGGKHFLPHPQHFFRFALTFSGRVLACAESV